MRVAGLFAGVGGIELGLHRAGFETDLLCEINPAAIDVLRHRFDGVPIAPDVRALRSLPRVDVVTAGFPCQDLSQAGQTAGIGGSQSRLVEHVFRLLAGRMRPEWLVLENVRFMLHLDRGRAMRLLTKRLESLRFAWAYRVVDGRAFGLPHRRQRVILVASRTSDPRSVLFGQDAAPCEERDFQGLANGFYWTEGLRGLGWTIDAVPPLKGGSSWGIPSPPAIWLTSGRIVRPEIRDAERLQGFPAAWTRVAARGPRSDGARWKLIGNAVSVPMAEWLGGRLLRGGSSRSVREDRLLPPGSAWPDAAWGTPGSGIHAVDVSMWPVRKRRPHLEEFLRYEPSPLSVRACDGFLERARRSTLRFPDGLLEAISLHRDSIA